MRRFALFACLLIIGGCGGDSTSGPEPGSGIVLEPMPDGEISWVSSSRFRVIARDSETGQPVTGVPVVWSRLSRFNPGAPVGATLTIFTDEFGVSTFEGGSPSPRTVTLVAAPLDSPADSVTITRQLVHRPEIVDIAPRAADAGSVVTIRGRHLPPQLLPARVLFDGIAAAVLTASDSVLTVRIPECMPTRPSSVTVGMGPVLNLLPFPVTVRGGAASAPLALAPGQVLTLSGDAFRCISMPSTAGASYLVASHNVSDENGVAIGLNTYAVGTAPIAGGMAAPAVTGFAEMWEAAHRRRAALGTSAPILHEAAGIAAQPDLGERRSFNVIAAGDEVVRVTAALRHIGPHTFIYVDTTATDPFDAGQLNSYGTLFDRHVYPAVTQVFGAPSDVDGNDRIILLMTPAVNALTPRGTSGFVAGYSDACDVLSRLRCPAGNRAEIIYTVVPDIGARWGDARTHAAVEVGISRLLAHDLQHMINFTSGSNEEDAWLAEGLAHTAEEIVGEKLLAEGSAAAPNFLALTHSLARQAITVPQDPRMLADDQFLTSRGRGMAWLLLRYLRSQAGAGANDLLRRLTGSSRTGVASVVAESATPWPDLLANFGVALWADGAPQLRTAPDRRYTFPDYDLRARVGTVSVGNVAWSGFSHDAALHTGGHSYYFLQAPAGTVPALSLNFTDEFLGPPSSKAVVTIMRVQ